MTFQLALIPGSLLAGFLLSPLLYLSRHLAQKPAHRLRFPHEKPVHRRLLALGFYAGSAIVCGGLVGFWTRWCLDWRDPFVWVAMFFVEGKRWWTRPVLLSYWGALAIISVAGWNRQLVRARRHRRYDPPSQPSRAERNAQLAHETTSSSTASGGVPANGHSATSLHTAAGHMDNTSGFAQMMNAADQRLPTFSVNARRKFFHALAVVMFVPGIALDVSPASSTLNLQCRLTTSWLSIASTQFQAETVADTCLSQHLPTFHSASHLPYSISRNTFAISPFGHLAYRSIYS